MPALYVLASIGIMASAVAANPFNALIAAAIPLYLVWERRAIARG